MNDAMAVRYGLPGQAPAEDRPRGKGKTEASAAIDAQESEAAAQTT